jgi:hypothetical protein
LGAGIPPASSARHPIRGEAKFNSAETRLKIYRFVPAGTQGRNLRLPDGFSSYAQRTKRTRDPPSRRSLGSRSKSRRNASNPLLLIHRRTDPCRTRCLLIVTFRALVHQAPPINATGGRPSYLVAVERRRLAIPGGLSDSRRPQKLTCKTVGACLHGPVFSQSEALCPRQTETEAGGLLLQTPWNRRRKQNKWST